jgi:hypothetical protein
MNIFNSVEFPFTMHEKFPLSMRENYHGGTRTYRNSNDHGQRFGLLTAASREGIHVPKLSLAGKFLRRASSNCS